MARYQLSSMVAGIMYVSLIISASYSYGQQSTIKDLINPMLDAKDSEKALLQLDDYGEATFDDSQQTLENSAGSQQTVTARIGTQTTEETISYLRKHHLKMIIGTWKRLLYDDNYGQLVRDAIVLQNHSYDVKVIPTETTSTELTSSYIHATQYRFYSNQFITLLMQIQARRATHPREAATLRGLAAENFGNIVKLCISCHSQYKSLPSSVAPLEKQIPSAEPKP